MTLRNCTLYTDTERHALQVSIRGNVKLGNLALYAARNLKRQGYDPVRVDCHGITWVCGDPSRYAHWD